eukprot:3933115-Rhodomonas_salina.3
MQCVCYAMRGRDIQCAMQCAVEAWRCYRCAMNDIGMSCGVSLPGTEVAWRMGLPVCNDMRGTEIVCMVLPGGAMAAPPDRTIHALLSAFPRHSTDTVYGAIKIQIYLPYYGHYYRHSKCCYLPMRCVLLKSRIVLPANACAEVALEAFAYGAQVCSARRSADVRPTLSPGLA